MMDHTTHPKERGEMYRTKPLNHFLERFHLLAPHE